MVLDLVAAATVNGCHTGEACNDQIQLLCFEGYYVRTTVCFHIIRNLETMHD